MLGITKNLPRSICIISHDPERIYFSENTAIGEMLIVCRASSESSGAKPPTRVVKLARNPSTPAEAVSAAQSIMNNSLDSLGAVQEWRASKIADGDWGAVQFLSPYLCQQYSELKDGRLFDSVALIKVADIGPDGRGVRGMFSKSEMPGADGMTALWDHKTDVSVRMQAAADTHIIPKAGKTRQARNLWKNRGRLLLPARARLNTVRTMAVRLPAPALGSAWVPCRPKWNVAGDESAEKSLCVYLNSTIGILAFLGNRSIRVPSYSQFSMDDLNRLAVPNFAVMEAESIQTLADAYDANAQSTLSPLPDIAACQTRAALDRAVCAALGVDEEVAATIRAQLAAEPAVTGRRYGAG